MARRYGIKPSLKTLKSLTKTVNIDTKLFSNLLLFQAVFTRLVICQPRSPCLAFNKRLVQIVDGVSKKNRILFYYFQIRGKSCLSGDECSREVQASHQVHS